MIRMDVASRDKIVTTIEMIEAETETMTVITADTLMKVVAPKGFFFRKHASHLDDSLRNYSSSIIRIIVRSFGSNKNTKLEDGPYCTISGNEPSSVTLYKTGSESQTFCCSFKNLHLCSLNQRLKFPKVPNNQNTVKKMILNI